MNHKLTTLLCLMGGLIWLSMPSCKHEPFEVVIAPIDTTTQPVDTTMVDTMGIPCEDNIVYFELQILPILQSNCAFSGCHDVDSAEDGVILESYEYVMQTADVEPFNLDDSEIYEVLVDDDEDEKMPPVTEPPLSSSQVSLIAQWILQGAENLTCDPNAGGCDTEDVSFSQFIQPTIEHNCQGCHSGNPPSGGINLTGYASIREEALNGNLYQVINHQTGYEAMPQGADKLSQCTIDKIASWIDAGAVNN